MYEYVNYEVIKKNRPKTIRVVGGVDTFDEEVNSHKCLSCFRPASPNFSLEPYSLNYPRMGRCIIINQKFFAPSTNLDTRHGTDEDVRSLAWSFTRLHFQVRNGENGRELGTLN